VQVAAPTAERAHDMDGGAGRAVAAAARGKRRGMHGERRRAVAGCGAPPSHRRGP
jgi:hypothetical protein